MKKKDLKLIIVVLVAIFGFYVVNLIVNSKKGTSIEVYVDNKLYKTIDINDEVEFKIKGKNGYNIVRVHDKGVEMVEASCPDKVCVHTGFIDKPSQSIVCIPNKVTIKIKTDKKDSHEDIISQ